MTRRELVQWLRRFPAEQEVVILLETGKEPTAEDDRRVWLTEVNIHSIVSRGQQGEHAPVTAIVSADVAAVLCDDDDDYDDDDYDDDDPDEWMRRI
jgi:hypothetical protein